MKYKDVDFSMWLDSPDEQAWSDWVSTRKEKRAKTTQTAVNRAGKWVNMLYSNGYSATTTLAIACEKGWQGLEWVYENERKGGFKDGIAPSFANVTSINSGKNTRDTTLIEEFDRGWAD